MADRNMQNWNVFWKEHKTPFLALFIMRKTHEKMLSLINNLNIPKNSKVVDFGSGTGRTLAILKIKYPQAIGIDNSKMSLDISSKVYDFKLGRDLKEMDCMNTYFKDKEIDLVFSEGLLEHFKQKDLERLIKEMCRVSKKYIILLQPSFLFFNLQKIYCFLTSTSRMNEYAKRIEEYVSSFEKFNFKLKEFRRGFLNSFYIFVFERKGRLN